MASVYPRFYALTTGYFGPYDPFVEVAMDASKTAWERIRPHSLSITKERMREIDDAFDALMDHRERAAKARSLRLLEDRIRILSAHAQVAMGCETVIPCGDEQIVEFSWIGDRRKIKIPFDQFLKLFGRPCRLVLRVVK